MRGCAAAHTLERLASLNYLPFVLPAHASSPPRKVRIGRSAPIDCECVRCTASIFPGVTFVSEYSNLGAGMCVLTGAGRSCLSAPLNVLKGLTVRCYRNIVQRVLHTMTLFAFPR